MDDLTIAAAAGQDSAATPVEAPAPTSTIVGFAVSRTAVAILIRFPYTFLTAISAGLGLSIAGTTNLLGLRELPGLATPFVGRFVDRGHTRSTMAVGFTCATVGCWVVATGWLPIVVVAMFLSGIGGYAIATSQNAWIGHRVPFARRGRAIGLVELSWAIAFLVGGPACAWLIDHHGWRSSFWVVGAAIAISGGVTVSQLGPDVVEPRDAEALEGSWARAFSRKTAGLYIYAGMQPFAQIIVFAVYGDWLSTRFGMSTALIGTVTVFIGVGEFVGTGASSAISDRLGKRRCTVGGAALAAPMALVLGVVGTHQVLGVAAMVVFAIGLEFSFVSALPLMTEMDPEARGLTLGIAFAIVTVGRTIGSSLSGLIYEHLGMWVCGIIACGALIVGGTAVQLGARHHR